MQLDTMRLAVRERNVLDTHDMALQVMRDFLRLGRCRCCWSSSPSWC